MLGPAGFAAGPAEADKHERIKAMFKSIDELIRSRRSRFQLWREALIAWGSGLAVAAAGFQTIYSMIFAFE
jgi:hypothetical protein